MGEGRHEPGQHRKGKFRIPHPDSVRTTGSIYQARKPSLIVRIIRKVVK